MDPSFYFGPPPDQQLLLDAEDYYLMTSLGMILSPAPGEVMLPPGSAFEAYDQRRRVPAVLETYSVTTMSRREQNLHRRMFGYLRRIAQDAAASISTGAVAAPAFLAATANETTAAAAGSQSTQAPRSSRFRHIMRERLRRERLSQGFADLHALLPPSASSKGGKNDIVGAAADYIRELAARKEWLSARNELLLQRAAATRWRTGGGGTSSVVGRRGMVVRVQAESRDHSVAVHAFERVLQRLRAMEELQVTAIRSRFSSSAGGSSMWMNVGVEGQVSIHDVDSAITNALMELEGNDPRRSKPSFSCQVESQMG